ncbi:hypothetical protein PAFU01_33610 [Pantoea ananatis]|nr:hypothetical protein PAFU01_33610 [Pantoea ananatis]
MRSPALHRRVVSPTLSPGLYIGDVAVDVQVKIDFREHKVGLICIKSTGHRAIFNAARDVLFY